MSPRAEIAIGTVLAVLGGAVFALIFYIILSRLLNFPQTMAVSIAAMIGGVQYFALRYWLLVGGALKGGRDDGSRHET